MKVLAPGFGRGGEGQGEPALSTQLSQVWHDGRWRSVSDAGAAVQ